MSYESWGLRRLPRFLRGPWGTLFSAAICGVVQRTEDAARSVIEARYAATAPSDALPYLANDTRLPRFLAGDTEGELRARLADPWSFHANVGKAAGVDDVMAILGFDPAETFILDRSVADLWHHAGGYWSQFSIATRNPTGWDLRADLWNDLYNAETTWGDLSGETWDFTCDASTFEQLRAYLWEYKWAHSIPVYVSMTFGDGYTWDDLLARGDTWTEVYDSLADWDDLAGADTSVYVIQTARLWGSLDLEGGHQDLTWDDFYGAGIRWARCMTAR
jgi:hypothetical protein